jgi:hypothetical protein
MEAAEARRPSAIDFAMLCPLVVREMGSGFFDEADCTLAILEAPDDAFLGRDGRRACWPLFFDRELWLERLEAAEASEAPEALEENEEPLFAS